MQTKLYLLTACLILLFEYQLPVCAQATDLRLKTVVIDPGHGGKDPGCMRNGIQEKNIVLSVALELGRMIQDSIPGIKVIYTRTTDKFLELQERAAIANRNNSDLFISIHVNSTKSTLPHGSETFCMGLNMSDDNMEVCQMENSVITLEDDYSSKYEGFDPLSPESYIIFSLLQNSHLEQSLKFAEDIQHMCSHGPIGYSRGVRQAGFVVLWRCTSPAVLTELGFLSNDADFKILSNREYHTALAKDLFDAVKVYRGKYEFNRGSNSYTETISASEKKTSSQAHGQRITVTTDKSAGGYAIQVLSSDKLISKNSSELKGMDCYTINVNGLYKYLTGHYATVEEAKKELPDVRKLFNDAFIIYVPNQ